MTNSEKFLSLIMVYKARKHIVSTMKLLENTSYEALIQQNYPDPSIKSSITVIVKSYFWASRLIKSDLCLPRSIALYQHLYACDHNVEHKFGIHKDNNLSAHAWVELKHIPLNEAANLKQNFRVLEKPDYFHINNKPN